METKLKLKINHKALKHSLILSLLLLCSCSSAKYMPLETVRTDSVNTVYTSMLSEIRTLVESMRHTSESRDTLIIRDSVLMVVNQQGDVVYKERKSEKEKSHSQQELIETMRLYYDSIINEQRQSIAMLYDKISNIPLPVEKRLTWWEKTKMDFGGAAIGTMAIAICVAVIWMAKKFKK